MARVALARFERALAGARRIAMDTAVLIYHLEDISPYSELTTHLLSLVAVPDVQLILSVITLGEVLAGPWKAGDGDRAQRVEMALRALPGVAFAGVDISPIHCRSKCRSGPRVFNSRRTIET